MRFGVPWSVKGIRPEARETAREAARRSGMSLGDWLNSVILNQAADDGVQAPSRYVDDEADEIASVHQRLDDLTRRIEQATRSKGPEAYAPKRSRNDTDQIAALIDRLDRRLDQFANSSRPMMPVAPMVQTAPAMPGAPLPPALDLAVAEIAARQRALNGQSLGQSASPHRAPYMAPAMPSAPMPPPAPVLAPAPVQDISGLEGQLRRITDQIETLRKPGVEEAINALRAELGEIGRALSDAMPRREIETIERQIAGLSQRIAEGRQAGIDGGALSGVEHGLAEVRDTLRMLTPAENLVGFNEAVNGLAHKIDLIVGQKDPATLQQLERSITTLREMAAHVASNEAVGLLSDQVQLLGQKVDELAQSGGAVGALNSLEHRIGALADALEQRAQSGGNVPPMLDALVHSLSDKIELIQQSRGDNVALGHLEDRIVKLVERLDASDSRLGHLEAIERGLADLLVHIEEMRANKDGLRAGHPPAVDALKTDMARTQDALQQVNGTLGSVVDRLATIEKGMRGETRPRPVSDEEYAEITQPVGRIAARVVSDTPPPPAATHPPRPVPVAAPAPPPPPPPPAPAPAAKRLPPATQLPINPDLPADEPLEPGSGPPSMRAGPRIADLARPGAASPAGKSGFIAAARRAAQAAVQVVPERAPVPEPIVELEPDGAEAGPSLRRRLTKKMKSLFIAASVIAIVVGSVQIIGNNFYNFGAFDRSGSKLAQAPDLSPVAAEAPIEEAEPQTTASATPSAPPLSPITPLTQPSSLAITPPLTLPSAQSVTTSTVPPPAAATSPSLLNPNSDVTGSIPIPRPPRPAAPPPQLATNPELPVAIGGPRLRNAALAGDAAAAFEIGARYADGRGVPADLTEAAHWYERAANKGLTPAQFRYASLLEKGQGVRKDLAQARRLYLAAASKGNGKAMHNLAVLYAEGIEGKPDYNTAATWFRKAAQHGIADSQYNLGVLCARGLGTAQSFEEAYMWFALAANQGDREAVKKRDEVATHLDPAGLTAAQQSVTSFSPTPQPEEATVVPEPSGGWDRASTTAPPAARPKPRTNPPMSIGALEVGKR